MASAENAVMVARVAALCGLVVVRRFFYEVPVVFHLQ